MNLQEYIGKKGLGTAKASLKLIEKSVEARLIGDNVPRAEVSANLRKVLGIPQGTETAAQRTMMDQLLRAASWAAYEAPPTEGELADALADSSWGGLVKVSQAIGATSPKINTLAKRVARTILTEHIDPAFVADEHGGEKQFAVNAVLERLFPKAGDSDDPKTSREAYLRRMFDEMLEVLGG